MSSKLRRSFPDKVKWNTERHLYKLANGNSSNKKNHFVKLLCNIWQYKNKKQIENKILRPWVR